jgi:OmpA-OmpF porin, OOP family
MRSTTTTAAGIALVIAALLPGIAAAEVTIGANLGSSRVDGGDFEGSDTGWKVHIGSSFAQFIGGEIGYVDFGRLGGGNGPRADAWAPAVTIGVPLGVARIYGKGGVAFANVEGSSVREEYKNEDPFYGVGLRFGMTPGLGFRAEYERYQFENDDIDMAQAGIELNF